MQKLHLLLWLLLPSLGSGAVLSIGHRGDSLYAPENTLASFRSALEKADFVETDGRPTKDGVLVVMHDASVNRTTDGTGNVSDLTLAQIKLLDAGIKFSTNFIGERVPTLEEMITNVLHRATPLIEQKAGSARSYLDLLQRLNVTTNVVIQSFDWNFLAQLHSLAPEVRLGALGSGTFTTAQLTTITNAGACMVAWESAGVNETMLNMVHAAGLSLFVWTVDGPAIKRYIDLGVDGIISNDPGSVRAYQEPTAPEPVALLEGLTTYWRMDDGLTNTMTTSIADSRTNLALSLTRIDGVSHWAAQSNSMFGGSVHLDGANSYIVVPRNSITDIDTNAFSFSTWIKLRDLPSGLAGSYGAILDSTNDCYVLYLDKSNRELRFKVTDSTGGAARPGIPESALTTNQWIHILATYNGNTTPGGQAAIYLNGQMMDLHYGSDANPPNGLTGPVRAGQYAAMGREGPLGGSYFVGYLDDVAMWKRALNMTEAKALYDGGKLGQSLADLTALPTKLIEFKSSRWLPVSQTFELEFWSGGPWTTFRLLRATNISGPYLAVPDLAPVSLGRSQYRFTAPQANVGSAAWFRVEAQ